MENEINVQDEIKMRLTPMAEQYMLASTRWAKFLSILGFVVAGFLLIFSLSLSSILSLAATFNPAGGAGLAGVPIFFLSAFYIGMSVIYFMIALYMYNFATKTQRGILKRDEYSMEAGFKALKSQLTLMGVMAVIGLALFALIIVIAIIVGIASAVS